MAYNAARDSQEGVLCKLVDELRDSSTKETGLALTALLLHCWREQQQQQQQQQQQDPSAAAAYRSGSRSETAFSISDLDHACEAFLQRRFDVHVSGHVCAFAVKGQQQGWSERTEARCSGVGEGGSRLVQCHTAATVLLFSA
jgi:hypothetical protein